jgi:hypothetical protein
LFGLRMEDHRSGKGASTSPQAELRVGEGVHFSDTRVRIETAATQYRTTRAGGDFSGRAARVKNGRENEV